TLHGKPLIYYSILNALSMKCFEVDCFVSSDDEEILYISSKLGAKTINRTIAISGDEVTLDPVIYDAYSKIKKIENKSYNFVITLQPPSPLLKSETLIAAINKAFSEKIDTLISGVWDSHLTWTKKDGKFYKNYEKRVNRQQLPEIF